jgi:hypothetical protein
MSTRELRRRFASLVNDLPIRSPFSLDAFIEDLAAARARPIRLIPRDLPQGAPCGLCIATETTDYVVVAADATGVRMKHIVFHELSHLLCGHVVALEDSTGVAGLLSYISPEQIDRTFARTTYNTVIEQEAETLATLIGQRVKTVERPASSVDADPLIARLERSLAHGKGPL